MSIPDNWFLICFSFPRQLVIIFVPHIKFLEVENLGQTCFSYDLMVSVEMNDSIIFNVCILTIFFQMWFNDKMLGPRTSQQTYFLLHSGQTARDKTLSTVLHPLPWRQKGSNWSHQPSFWRWVWASTVCPHGLFPVNRDSAVFFIAFVTASISLPIKWEQQRFTSLIMKL